MEQKNLIMSTETKISSAGLKTHLQLEHEGKNLLIQRRFTPTFYNFKSNLTLDQNYKHLYYDINKPNKIISV